MKIRTTLLVACLAVAGSIKPINAEVVKNASPPKASARVNSLESVLRQSGLCKQYPIVVKISPDNTALLATYADRSLSDKEIKLLALQMSKLISSNVDKIAAIKIRLYDPASTKYWKDINLSPRQMQEDLRPTLDQEQTLKSIKIVSNFGLADGPNLEYRADLYKHILKLQQEGIKVEPFQKQLETIETAEAKKENISAQLSELDAALIKAEPVIKPVETSMKTNARVLDLKDLLKDANDREKAALVAVQEAEREQRELDLPEASFPSNYDMDAQARYEDHYEGLQKEINENLKRLHEAHQNYQATYEKFMQARINSSLATSSLSSGSTSKPSSTSSSNSALRTSPAVPKK